MSGINLTELQADSVVVLTVKSKGKSLQINAWINKILKEDVAFITLDYDTKQILKFDNVTIELDGQLGDGTPVKWNSVKIGYYQKHYILQTDSEGKRHNRREYFRVGVSKRAQMKIGGQAGIKDTIVRDISMGGFSVTDQKKEYNLSPGDTVTIHFEDLGHVLDLVGEVVHSHEEEDVTIYGLKICNLCKDLSSYISVKQRNGRLSSK